MLAPDNARNSKAAMQMLQCGERGASYVDFGFETSEYPLGTGDSRSGQSAAGSICGHRTLWTTVGAR
jgi:hypothetical protein